MSAVLTRPENIVNDALVRIGSSFYVENLFDGSKASNAALAVYSQTRDDLLRLSNWDFAEKIALASVTGNAPPSIWTAEYTYPTDCIKVRDLYGTAYTTEPNLPIPTRWTVANTANGKVIWSNIASATLVYTRQITNPALWEPAFTEALCAALGRRLVVALVGANGAEIAAKDEVASIQIAAEIEG